MGGGTLTTLANDLSEADRRFIAYAAHGLRGSIALQLTLAETTLADPNADTAALREMGEGVLAACERQARLLEALHTLAPKRARTSATRTRRPCRNRRRSLTDLPATSTHADHDTRARPNNRRPAVARAPHCQPDRQRHRVPRSRWPDRHRHLHGRGTCHLHDRKHRTRRPTRRAHPPLPTVPATELSRRALCQRDRARPRHRASDRQRACRHHQHTSPNRRRPDDRH